MEYFNIIAPIIVLLLASYSLYQTWTIHRNLTNKKFNDSSGIISLLSILLVLIILFIPYLFTTPMFQPYNYETTGAIGDTINGLTAPFITGVGAILVYLSFKEQVRMNQLQLDSVKKVDSLNKEQAFESNFFSLIQNHHQLLEGLDFIFYINETIRNQQTGALDVVPVKIPKKGLGCLLEFNRQFKETISIEGMVGVDMLDEFDKLYRLNHSFLSHLIRNLYLFVKYVDEKELEKSDTIKLDDGEYEILLDQLKDESILTIQLQEKRYEYMKILRAQISSDLLLILALNSFTARGINFQFYIRKYRLLKNINLEEIPSELKNFFFDLYPHILIEYSKLNQPQTFTGS